MLKKIFLIIIVVIILIGSVYIYLSKTYPETSPFITGVYYIESLMSPHAKLNKHVMGFLPYWRIKELQTVKPQLLSEINYFSLSVNTDGHIKKIVDGQTDPGWREWQSSEMQDFVTKAHIMGTDVSITIAALDNDLITTLLDSDDAQQNLIGDIIKETKTRNLDAVNIDFEYVGEPDDAYRQAFTSFSKQLSTELKKETPKTRFSISIMPLAARQNDLYDFPKLVPLFDHFIGMSYDYYGENSAIAGPIAPMQGFKENKYFFDVTTTYEDFLKVIPKEKIIMGIPYYGWEWAVEDGKTINSLTFPSDNINNYAAVISYARARESQDIKKNQCIWDTYAQETWCWFKDSKTGIDHQVWLADNRSIQTRFEYANKQNFGGIAIWTLGFDKDYPDLWDMLRNKFSK